MKKFLVLVSVAMLILSSVSYAAPKEDIDTISDGDILYSAGHALEDQIIPLGFDDYGYNYNSHLFKGSYFNVYSGKVGLAPYMGEVEIYLIDNDKAPEHWAWNNRDIEISMKWNDAWLSNKDQDEDGLLDRHFGYDSYIGSGAWEMYKETYIDDGKIVTYTCKIVAVPLDAYLSEGCWYTADDVEIGLNIWGQFAITQEVSNGLIYNSILRSGLGNW